LLYRRMYIQFIRQSGYLYILVAEKSPLGGLNIGTRA